MIRVVHTLGPISRRAGGLHQTVSGLARALAAMPGVDVAAFGIQDDFSEADRARWEPCPLTILPVSPLAPPKLMYAPRMVKLLVEHNPDLVHCHGIWTYHAWATLSWQRRSRRPYLVSTRGMVDPPGLAKSRLVKFIAKQLYVNRLLHGAPCIHVLGETEVQSARAFGLRNPLCVIPNGVDLAPTCEGPAPWDGRLPPRSKVLLYIGRIFPDKGIPFLLDGWAQARRAKEAGREWRLVIAGWDQEGHEAELKAQALALGIDADTCFAGPLFGPAKTAALSCASAFVLPSKHEAMPSAVLEAWASGLPVIMTAACNIPAGFSTGAALRVEPDGSSIARGLLELFSMDDAQRQAMGTKGRKLVEERYRWPIIAAQMKAVYEWMLGGGNPPVCLSLT